MIEENEGMDIIRKTEIQQFFTDQSIFITGSTGFLGKILLEKILRSCGDLKKVYILVREKRGLNVSERCTKIFNKELFTRLKKENPFYENKLCFIIGDCEQPDLGISDEDKKLLLKEVTTIFHVAATVKFNEPIATAAKINVRSVRDLIKMAKQMDQLKSFVHVSTAYSNCNRESIDEKFYPAPINADKLLSIIDLLDNDLLEAITPRLIKQWPNTYIYTKVTAESIINENARSLPIAVVRPGIVFPTIEDPVPGWSDTIYGPVGIIIGSIVGFLRCFYATKDGKPEIVPADYVTNNIIAAAWDIGISTRNEDVTKESNIPIYNYVSSSQNPIRWSDVQKYVCDLRWTNPTNRMIWYPFIIMTDNLFLYYIFDFILHKIPGYFIDLLLRIVGKKPMLIPAYHKIDKFLDTIKFFSTRDWRFSDYNTQKLWMKLSKEDQKIFKFDISTVCWCKAVTDVCNSGRKLVLKDPLSTIPQAVRKMHLLWAAHYILISLTVFLGIKLLMIFINIIL